jgi:large subunit ribosomal protein L31
MAKEGIHPNYPAAAVNCACGNAFVTRSTKGDFQVDVCAACHPFYTGTQKLIDTAGRVDRFRKRYEKGAKMNADAAAARAEKAPAAAAPAQAKEETKEEAAS